MKAPGVLLSVALALSTAASSLPSGAQLHHRQSSVLPPFQDPFYQPTAGFESAAPGTILDSRKLSAPVGGSSQSYQLLLRSTDSNGNPNAIVTTILVPDNANPKKLLSSQDRDEASVDCSPSYIYQLQNNTAPNPVVEQALANGWYVAAPDGESFNASFGNGVQGGQATLDNIRAALSSKDITGIEPDAAYAINGYSGSSISGEFALELQPSYAPELNIAGAALGGLTPDPRETVMNCNASPGSGLVTIGILGFTAQDADLRAYVESKLIPANASKFNEPLTACAEQWEPFFAGQDIFADYFVDDLNIVEEPMLQPLIHRIGIMGLRGTPKVPIYAYKGVLDQVSNITVTDALVDKYCADGAQIEYERASGRDHISEQALGAAAAFAWLNDRLNGVSATTGCSVTTC